MQVLTEAADSPTVMALITEGPGLEQSKQILIIPLIREFFNNADPKDLFIISKFYFTGKPFPNDTASFIFAEFCDQTKRKLKVTTNNAIRKRLDRMARVGIVLKLGANPKIYAPVDDNNLIAAIRELIKRSYADYKESTDNVFKPV